MVGLGWVGCRVGFSPPLPPLQSHHSHHSHQTNSANLTYAVTRRLVPVNRCRLKTAEMMGLSRLDWLGWVGLV
ncbi:TPA: hypothetical protein ACFRHD_001579 [Neisseria lactamica]